MTVSTQINAEHQISEESLRRMFQKFRNEQLAKPIQCPQCGGPFDPNAGSKCGYCDTPLSGLVTVDYHTRITRIEFEVDKEGLNRVHLPTVSSATMVYHNGLLMAKDDYSISDQILYFRKVIPCYHQLTIITIDGPGVVAF